MMRIGFLSAAVPGHLNPTTALARRLQARGHDVALIAVLDAESHARAAQLPFIPYSEKEYPVGAMREITNRLSKLQGQAALEHTIRIVANDLEASFRNLPQTLLDARVDALVVDQAKVGLGLVPTYLGMPYVHISNALHFDYSGNTPFCVFDWPHEETPEAQARNRAGLQGFMKTFEPTTAAGRAFAEQVGLDVDWTDPWATISRLAWLTQTPKEFDFQSSHWPSWFHYTGPFHDGSGRIDADFPWERLTGEPLIYASMGTLQNGLDTVFHQIAEAVGTRPGLQLVLSIGSSLDPAQIRSLPANAIVVQKAPQIELLKRAVLCITHSGLNTTLESLTQGVPMVAIPVTNDQPGVAARIAYTKTGVFLPLKEMTVPRLASLIDEVLSNPEYRDNANQIKKAIAKTDGLEKAADLLEEVFQLSKQTVEQ